MTVFVVLLTASTSFLILSGLVAFSMLAWRGPPPPLEVVEAPYADDPGPEPWTPSPDSGPGLDDPDPGSDVWTEFDRRRDPALV